MTKVSIQRDLTLNMIVPITATHHFVPLPPVPPIPPPLTASPLSLAAAAIEIPVTIYWPPGFALGQNKLTTTVYHKGMTIALDGHDCGILIIHIQITPAPNNMLTLLHIPFSSRKAAFSASKVTGNGNPIACCTMIAWPPTPMVYCADPMSPPLASAPTSHLNSVVVGMTLGDWIFGAISIAADMLLDWLTRSPIPSDFGWKNFGKSLLGKFIPTDADAWKEWGVKQGIGALLGLSRGLLTNQSSEVGVKLGGPYLNIGGKVNFANGPASAEVGSRIGNVGSTISTTGVDQTVGGLDGSTKRSRNWGEPGPTTTQTSYGGSSFPASTTTTAPDGTVTVQPGRGPTQTTPPGTTL